MVLAGVLAWSALRDAAWLNDLRSVSACRTRCGQRFTAGLLLLLAALLLLLACGIIGGVRPGYAISDETAESPQPIAAP